MTTLITTIGIGGPFQSSNQWGYKEALYSFDKSTPVKTSYIGKAVLESQWGKDLSKIIVLGTPSTGWANLLNGFGLSGERECEGLWYELTKIEEDAKTDKSVGVSIIQLEKLKTVLEEHLQPLKFDLHPIPACFHIG